MFHQLRRLAKVCQPDEAAEVVSVAPQTPGFIKALDCICLFLMYWVVTAHSLIYLHMPGSFMPAIYIPKQIGNHLLFNAFISVDIFFVLSDIVLAYLFFKNKPKQPMIMNPITWMLFYIHRYFRATTPIMLFIGFISVYPSYIYQTGKRWINTIETREKHCYTKTNADCK